MSNGLDGVVSRSPMYCDCRQDLVDRRGYDCFGQSQSSTSGEPIDCPHCGQKTGATRFAAHLARCMGGGGRTTTRQSRAGPSPQQAAKPPIVSSSNGSDRVRTPPPTTQFGAGAAGQVLEQKLKRKAESSPVENMLPQAKQQRLVLGADADASPTSGVSVPDDSIADKKMFRYNANPGASS